MSEWRDISTRPKSGTYLIFQPKEMSGRTQLAARVCLSGDGGFIRKATLWAPIPKLPEDIGDVK